MPTLFRSLLCIVLASAVTAAAQAANTRVVLTTTLGDLVIELYDEQAPATVANFLAYVDDGFYDGTVFHRVIPEFVAQGGGYSADLRRKQTRPPIANEADNGLLNTAGTLSMARTGDPHSATSQFFINLVDNPNLDHRDKGAGWGYAVFGRVVDGDRILARMAATRTGAAGPFNRDVPLDPIIIQSARRQPAP